MFNQVTSQSELRQSYAAEVAKLQSKKQDIRSYSKRMQALRAAYNARKNMLVAN